MSTWDDKPNDYESAVAEIERMQSWEAEARECHRLIFEQTVEVERLKAELAAERERWQAREKTLENTARINLKVAQDRGAELAAERERWRSEVEQLRALVNFADNLRAAQRAYMADRGNNEKGQAVAMAARHYDAARACAAIGRGE